MIRYKGMNQGAGHRIETLMEQNEIVALGASLRQIELMKPIKQDYIRVWYQGGEPYFDVFVDFLGGKIDWFQFTWRGQVLLWKSQTSGWQTGRTNEWRSDDMTFYSGNKIIEIDKEPDLEFIELARLIIQTRAGEEIFDQIIKLFDNHNKN
jgi:hypothetical protein